MLKNYQGKWVTIIRKEGTGRYEMEISGDTIHFLSGMYKDKHEFNKYSLKDVIETAEDTFYELSLDSFTGSDTKVMLHFEKTKAGEVPLISIEIFASDMGYMVTSEYVPEKSADLFEAGYISARNRFLSHRTSSMINPNYNTIHGDAPSPFFTQPLAMGMMGMMALNGANPTMNPKEAEAEEGELICPACSFKNGISSKFCSNCGTPIRKADN